MRRIVTSWVWWEVGIPGIYMPPWWVSLGDLNPPQGYSPSFPGLSRTARTPTPGRLFLTKLLKSDQKWHIPGLIFLIPGLIGILKTVSFMHSVNNRWLG